MTLTKQQKQRIRDQLDPVIRESAQEIVQDEVRSLIRGEEPGEGSYTARALDASRAKTGPGRRRNGELTGAARTFARMGLAVAVGNGDSHPRPNME